MAYTLFVFLLIALVILAEDILAPVLSLKQLMLEVLGHLKKQETPTRYLTASF